MRIAGFLSLLLFAFPAFGQDPQRGRLLYETHCGACHYERLHERARSKIRNLSDLRDEVSRWAPQTRRSFTLDEREDVVQHLNELHYRFGLSPKARQEEAGRNPPEKP